MVPGGKFGPEMSHFFIFPKPPPFGLAVREKCSEEMWFVNISRTIVRSKGGGLGKMKKCDISGPNLPPGTTPKRGGSSDQYEHPLPSLSHTPTWLLIASVLGAEDLGLRRA